MDRRHGFTLVELMIVVVILGILAAIAIPLYMKFITVAKAGEARVNLGKIGSLLERYYVARSGQSSTTAVAIGVAPGMVPQYPFNNADRCATGGSGQQRVPDDLAKIRAMKYTPSEHEWTMSGGAPTAWADIPFSITQPITFQYCYHGEGTGRAAIFTVGAFGDTDGDGQTSSYRRAGAVLCTADSCAPSVGAIAIIDETD